jgi:hypothetical protein
VAGQTLTSLMGEQVAASRKAKASDYSPRKKMGALDKTNNSELIAQMVNFYWEEGTASEDYQGFCQQYDQNWMMYRGDQWFDEDMEVFSDSERSFLTRDICFRTVRRINPLLTDSRAMRYVKADRPDLAMEAGAATSRFLKQEEGEIVTDSAVARDLQGFWHAMERRQMAEAEFALGLTNFTIGGMAWGFPFWDKRFRDDPGFGRVNFLRDSKQVVLDPEMERADLSDARFIIIEKYYDADILQREAGLSNSQMTEIIEDQYPEHHTTMRDLMENRTNLRQVLDDQDSREMLFRPRIRVLECWTWSQLPIERLLDGAAKSVEHPTGRVFTVAGKHVIQRPIPNPYRHGMFPGIPYRDNADAHTVYGLGEINWLKHDQVALNLLINQMLTSVLLMGNPGIIAEEGALKSDPTDTPGEILETEQGKFHLVREKEINPLSPASLQLLNVFDQHAKERVNETMEGLPPGAQSSGVAISSLQDAAFTIIREKARALEWGYHRQGVQEVHNIIQFGTQAMVDEFVDRGYVDLGEFLKWHPRMEGLFFSIAVESKADLPENLMDRLKLALQLAGQGHIDSSEVLAYTQFPTSERLSQEMLLADAMEKEAGEMQVLQARKGKMDLLMQIAQSQQQMPGMGGAPPGGAPPGGGPAPPPQGGRLTPTGGAGQVGQQAPNAPQSNVVTRSQPPAA